MRTEFYIARRLSSRRDGGKAGVMERVAMIATAVSLAVVVVTLSVVVGFKKELDAKISSTVSDVVITAPESRGTVSAAHIERSTSIEQLLNDERVEHFSAYRAKEGVIRVTTTLSVYYSRVWTRSTTPHSLLRAWLRVNFRDSWVSLAPRILSSVRAWHAIWMLRWVTV